MRFLTLLAVFASAVLNLSAQFDTSYSCDGLDTLETWQGLRYCIIETYDGDTPSKGDRLTVSYKGYFENGEVFDSSQVFKFRLQKLEVIRGWDIAFGLLSEGDMARIFIPWKLAYGKHGNPPLIPRKADLIFDVKLIRVQD